MQVKLISIPDNLIDIAYLACKTCYSHNINENVSKDEKLNLIKKVISSGHYSTIEHIQVTFSIDGVTRACYDEKTEVLTKNGWKFFKNVSTQDDFATLNNKGEVEFQKAINFISYNYSGKMHSYKSQNLDLCVTPNHNMFIKKYDVRKSSNFNLTSSENINVKRFYMTKNFNYQNDTSKKITIKGYDYFRNYKGNKTKIVKTSDLELDKKYFFPFMAWYLSDGNVYYNEKENSYTINITQTECKENLRNKTRERIKELVENLGFTATSDKRTIKFKNQTLGKFLKELGHCDEKFIPYDIYKEFDNSLAKIFIDEYFKGDGHIDKNGCGKLYTTSKLLAEQLYQLCFIAGYTCKQYEVAPRGYHYIGNLKVNSTKKSYVINVTLTEYGRNRNIIVKKDKHFFEDDYNGKVYCVTVPNHTLFVRRNGIAIWCGNCTHQLVRHRHASYSQRSQRYINESNFKYVIPESIEKQEILKHQYENLMMLISNFYNDLVRYGIKKEDARSILPNACTTSLVMSLNLRELIHIANLRLCTRAQLEIRQLVKKMCDLVIEKEPWLSDYLVPKCVSLGYCNEHNSCGRVKTK